MWALKLLLTALPVVLPVNDHVVDQYGEFYKGGALVCEGLNDGDNKRAAGCCGSNDGRRSLTMSHRSPSIGRFGRRPVLLFVPGGGYVSHAGIGRSSKIISELGEEYDIVTLIYRLPCDESVPTAALEDLRGAITLLRNDYDTIFALGGSAGSHLLTMVNGLGPVRTDVQVLFVLPVMYGTQYGPIETTSNQTPPTYFAYGGQDEFTPNVSHYSLFDATLSANGICRESQYIPGATHSTTWNLLNYTHLREWLASYVTCWECCSVPRLPLLLSPPLSGDAGTGEATSGDNAISDHFNLHPVNPPAMPPSPSCVRCADRPSPWMQNRGRSCARAAEYISSKRCNRNVRWAVERYCEVTCEANGVGYNGMCCSQTAPSFPPSFPPSIPPLLPPLLPPRETPLIAPSPCIICTDKPTPYMENLGKSCASWATFITRRRCNASPGWLAKHYCERTCDANGVGYYASIHGGYAPLNRTPDCPGSPMQISTPSTRAPFVSHLMGIASNCSFGRAETCAVNVRRSLFYSRERPPTLLSFC